MEKLDFLPLGTVVVAKGEAQRKMVIIARGLAMKMDDKLKFFDYGGCFYPDGLFGNRILYFNREDIAEVVQKGYADEDDARQVEEINKWLAEHNMERGSVEEAKERAREQYKEAADLAKNQAASVNAFKQKVMEMTEMQKKADEKKTDENA